MSKSVSKPEQFYYLDSRSLEVMNGLVSQDAEEKIAGLVFLAFAILIVAIVFYVPDMFSGLPDIIQLILVIAAIFSFVIGLGCFGIGGH